MRQLLLYGFYLLVAAGGAVLAAVQIETLVGSHRVENWPTAVGRVVESAVTGERAIRPLIAYEYFVDSLTYRSESDLGAPMFGGRGKKYDVARELVGHYPVGTFVLVYYNPDSAAESTIQVGVSWDVYGKLGVGVLLCLLGMSGLLRPVLGIRKGL